jgi:hypothetical protein
MRRESSIESDLERSTWGHYVAVRDEWGVTEDEAREVSVEVHPVVEDSAKSSACRCYRSLHRFESNSLRTIAPSVLPREAAHALVPVSALSPSPTTERLPLALSAVLGITLSEVMERYFGGVSSSDGASGQVVQDVDRLVVQKDGEEWLSREQRDLEDKMEGAHRGEGVDDEF